MFKDVDWKNTVAAYENTELIPDLLEKLTHTSTSEATAIMFELRNIVFHQFTIYPATKLVIPYLVDMIENESIQCRSAILEFLGDITEHISNVIKLENKEASLNNYQKDCFELYDLVTKSLDLYIQLLSHNNFSFRMIAVYILSYLDNEKTYLRIYNVFGQLLLSEQNAFVKSSLIFGLAKLSVNHKLSNINYSQYEVNSDIKIVYSSIIASFWIKNTITPRAIQRLLNFLLDYQNFENHFTTLADYYTNMFRNLYPSDVTIDIQKMNSNSDIGHFPWKRFCTRFEIIKILTNIDISYFDKLKPAFFYLLSIATENHVESIIEPIIKYTLRAEGFSTFNLASLTRTQFELMNIIYNNILLWIYLNVSVKKLIKKYNLPLQRKDWQQILKLNNPQLIPVNFIEESMRLLINRQLGKRNLNNSLEQIDYINIKKLSLQNVGNDNFVPFLQRLTELQELNLSNSEFTSNGITSLPIFYQLLDLQLAGIKCDEVVAQYISKHSNLQKLNLSNTGFENIWLIKYIGRLHRLNTLFLLGLNITNEVITELELLLPNCHIRY